MWRIRKLFSYDTNGDKVRISTAIYYGDKGFILYPECELVDMDTGAIKRGILEEFLDYDIFGKVELKECTVYLEVTDLDYDVANSLQYEGLCEFGNFDDCYTFKKMSVGEYMNLTGYGGVPESLLKISVDDTGFEFKPLGWTPSADYVNSLLKDNWFVSDFISLAIRKKVFTVRRSTTIMRHIADAFTEDKNGWCFLSSDSKKIYVLVEQKYVTKDGSITLANSVFMKFKILSGSVIPKLVMSSIKDPVPVKPKQKVRL